MILLFALSGIAQHVSMPFSELKEMAACGDGKVQLMLAKHFVDGDSIPKNFYMAMHWYAQAWRNGEGERIKAVFSEMSKPKNRKKYHGFVRFVDGTVVMNIHQDYRQSMKLLQDGYQNGNQEDDCLIQQGVLTQTASEEDSISLDMTTAEKKRLKERLLSTSSIVQGVIGKGMLEEKGDTVQALRLLESAAKNGFVHAHETLGLVYLQSKAPYYDAVKAVYHLQEAERGHLYRTCKWLAFCHEHELGGLTKDSTRISELEKRYTDDTDYEYCLMSWLSGEKWFAKRLYEI